MDNGIDRGASFLDEMSKSVRAGAATTAARIPVSGRTPQWETPDEITLNEWRTARVTPGCIVENLLFADVAILIAAGGTGKTTLILFQAIHIVLGRPLFGLEVRKPGPVVLLTAEDSREQLVARLRFIADAMTLSADELDRIRHGVRISDVSGRGFKLTAVVQDVVVPTGDVLGAIIAGCMELRPVLIVVDPAVSFGVGESRVNDAEQGLVESARRLRNELKCCVQFVHHTGKVNGREKTVDQYSGRGGSAFSDGSRMVSVLVSVSLADWKAETGEDLKPGESGLRLARAKQSYVAPQPDILIRRKGFLFEHVRAMKRDNGSDLAARANQIWQLLSEELKAGRHHTKTSLEELGVAGMNRPKIRSAVAWLVATGRIEIREWPVKRKGGAKEYMHPIETSVCPADDCVGPIEKNEARPADDKQRFAPPPPLGNSCAADQSPRTETLSAYGPPNPDGGPMADLADQAILEDSEVF